MTYASFLTAIWLMAAPQARHVEAPQILRAGPTETPYFVSVDAINDPAYGIEWEKFPAEQIRAANAAARATSESTLVGSEDPCSIVVTFDIGIASTGTFRDVIRRAGVVYVGQVVALRLGFVVGTTPATLLVLDAAPIGEKQARSLYLIYPEADFVVRGYRFCAAQHIPGFTPQVGDQIIVAAPMAPPESYPLLGANEMNVVFERGGETYYAPRGPTGGDISFKDLEQWVSEKRQ